ncbi:MAG TPA: S41 family peptidase [Candidatus Saccharimonadales bacterium]|nr:S41 family peptidase [Candidatus Saccharimonadales bacterium]
MSVSRKGRLVLGASILVATFAVVFLAQQRKLDRDSLIEDVRQLSDTIESVHPDPYVNGGGKVAYHRRLQETLAAIPEDGMDRADFYRLLRPFVTAVGDAHTWLRDAYVDGWRSPGGIPLYFGVVGTEVYVLGVPEEKYRSMIGSVLVSVEGVPYRELLGRLKTMVSADNEYQLLRNLAYDGILWSGPFLADLLPEWEDHGRVRIVLKDGAGREAEHTIPIPWRGTGNLIHPGSRLQRPKPGPAGFAWAFLDPGRKTAWLVVDGMEGYREGFEMWRAEGGHEAETAARELYGQLHDGEVPDDLDSVIAGLPSATETFRKMVQEMREAGTTTLLVDVRRNGGGNSAMADILLYFLYGRDVLLRAKLDRTEIRRYSDLYFETHSREEFDRANRERAVPLRTNDYDFSADWHARNQHEPHALEALTADYERVVGRMPTFQAEYRAGTFEKHYLPAKVMVLSSPRTFSSGYTLMYYLYRAGATIVGTPSAQAGNCFGETLPFDLKNSGLTGTISQKQFVYFHDDPEAGRVLRPDIPLTWEALRSHDFDLNTEALLALGE